MLHTDLILISNWGTFLQLVKCALVSLDSPLSLSLSLELTQAMVGELACENVMQEGEHLSVLTKAASITVLVFTWWETLLGSSSPFSSERMDV